MRAQHQGGQQRGGHEQGGQKHVQPMGAMALLSGLLLLAPAALACGGGGSGGYRKPVRPDHFNQTSTQPSNATSSAPASSSERQVQRNGL